MTLPGSGPAYRAETADSERKWMSLRELKELAKNDIVESRLRSEHPRGHVQPLGETVPRVVMSEGDHRKMEELQAELERVCGELDSKNDELAELKTVTDTAKTELTETKVRTEATLLAIREELDGAKAAADEAQVELETLRETSRKQTETF